MLKNKKLKAFSLIELSVVLLIIGIILGSIFKGMQLVESAKIQSVAQQFQAIRLDVEHYVTRYGEFPGPSLYTSKTDTQNAFQKLYEKGIVKSKQLIRSKLGGIFLFKTINKKHYIQLVSDLDHSPLNEKQIEQLKCIISQGNDSESCCMDGSIFSYLISEY